MLQIFKIYTYFVQGLRSNKITNYTETTEHEKSCSMFCYVLLNKNAKSKIFGEKWKMKTNGEARAERWKFLFCALLVVLLSIYIISWVVLRAYVQLQKTQRLALPKKNNILPTSHLDTTWQTETLKYGVGWGVLEQGAGGASVHAFSCIDIISEEQGEHKQNIITVITNFACTIIEWETVCKSPCFF